MICIPRKVKFAVSFIAVFASCVFAGNGSMNYYGQLGLHKTQSAQTLGHGVFGLGAFLEGTGLNDMVENNRICSMEFGEDCLELGSFIGLNGYPFLSLGLSDYFDFSISIPVYGEYLRLVSTKTDNGKFIMDTDNLSIAGQGDLHLFTKIRAPFNEGFPLDFALILGGSLSTGKTDDYGRWVHDPAFLPLDSTLSSSYTNGSAILKIGAAVTFDFNRMKAKIPLLLHLNGSYRMPLGEFGQNYPDVPSFSAAFELIPSQYISLFGEYYQDFPSAFPKLGGEEDYAGTSTFTAGTSFHLGKKVDLQLGFQMRIGDDDKYIDKLTAPGGYTYNAALIPKYMAFGGLTLKIFTVEPEEEEEEEVRSPDTDEDGVCDPWVARESRQREFARYCSGIDLCPYEEGPPENKGCPEEEEDGEAPTIIFNVDQESVSAGQTVTLSWVVTNANEVNIEGLGNVSLKGSKRVKPSETTKYTLTATGDGGTKTETIEVAVESAPGPSIVFNASPESIQKGQLVTLTWMVSEATEVNIEGIGKVSAKGTKKVKPSDAGVTTFTLTATGTGGTKTESVEVEVLGGPLPTILFSASSESIQNGQTLTLNWQTTNATEVSIEGIGKVPVSGTKKVKPTKSTVYTLKATGENGTQTATVEVEVEEAPTIEAKVNLQGVTFGSGNATLTPNAKKVLDGIAEQLLASPNVKIEIQGHTDNVGNPKSNQELSERRAKAVVGYLALKGVKTNRMSAVGYGQDAPIADNKTAEGRELNRRIEMIRIDN